jgi:Ran GTPase-activating protein (RanGAP) involved in mRNA processing and transport
MYKAWMKDRKIEKDEINFFREILGGFTGHLDLNSCLLNVGQKCKCVPEFLVALAAALSTNSTITSLDFSYNPDEKSNTTIAALSKALLINRTITNVDLSHNVFDASSSVHFADLLRTTQTIQTLNLSHTKFLDKNDVSIILQALAQNTSITELDISGIQKLRVDNRNTFSRDGSQLAALVKMISNNSTFRKLTFEQLKFDASEFFEIAEALILKPNITDISLVLGQFSDSLIKLIAAGSGIEKLTLRLFAGHSKSWINFFKALQSNCSIKLLCFQSIHIPADRATEFAAMIQFNTTITDLAISPIMSFGMADPIMVAISSNRTLTSVKFSFGLPSGPSSDITVPINALFSNESITKLDLSGSKLSTPALNSIAEALLQNKSITEINLSRCRIEDECVSALVVVIESNSIIKTLNLSRNRFRKSGFDSLVRALKDNTTIEDINLSKPKHGFLEPGECLSYMINSNSSITKLDLSSAYGRPNDMIAVSHALCANTTITDIRLSGFGYAHDEARMLGKAIASMIKSNSTITKLAIDQTDLDDEDMCLIGDAMKTNKTLTEMDLSRNQAGDAGAGAIVEMLKRNRNLRIRSINWSRPGDGYDHWHEHLSD